MKSITNLLVLLMIISMLLPASAILHASGASSSSSDDNNKGESSTGSTSSSDNNAGVSTTFNENNPTSSPESTTNNTAGNTQGVDINSVLAVHNQERAAVGVPPLTWSNALAASAQKWADQLLATGQLEHSTCCGAFKDYGENLAYAGPPGYKTQAGLAQTWADEKQNYVPCNPCNYSGTGHYTQMVWKATTEVGCGFASGPGGAYAKYGGTDILVCQYTPPGNWNNQPPY